jgi:biotin carboxyl carrier protein
MRGIIQSWLEQHCGQTSGAAGAVVIMRPRNADVPLPVAQWPAHTRASDPLLAAARAAYQQCSVVSFPAGGQHPEFVGPIVACPVQAHGRILGAVALRFDSMLPNVPARAASSLKSATQTLLALLSAAQVAPKNIAPAKPASHIADPLLHPGLDGAGRNQLGPLAVAPPPPIPPGAIAERPSIPTLTKTVDRTMELPTGNSARILNLLATIESHDDFSEAATAFVTELATLFGCTRVSVGLSGRRHVKVAALSHSAEIVERQGLIRSLGAAMEEAIWQGATLVFPLPEGAQPRVDRAHGDLVQRHGSAWVATIPLVRSGKPFGAVTLERSRSEGLSRSDLTLCENIGALLGPLLEVKHKVSKPWPAKLGGALREATAPLLGPGHVALKAIAVGVIALITAAALIQADYRVSARARLEGSVQRVLAAPADGYLKLAYVRPGDVVKEGQLLAELADDDLKLEERKAQSEVAQLENSYGTALVKQDRAEVAIVFAKLEEARAQLSLVQARLTRTQLRAPFNGLVITGDLSQSLGAPVKKGEGLMTVAPEHDFRVIVEVDERDVADVRTQSVGSLALSALPGDTMPLQVTRITPVATSADGRNFFEVEAKLQTAAPELRPGLIGVAKIEAGTRSWLWIWTHRVTDWLRLTLWSWAG